MVIRGQFYKRVTENRKTSSELKTRIEGTIKQLLEGDATIFPTVKLLGKIKIGSRASTGIIALGFDNGYDIAIILTRGTEVRAQQIYEELKEDFTSDNHKVQILNMLRIPDYRPKYVSGEKLIMIVKKEKSSLDKMTAVLIETIPALREIKLLIIDDEADFAFKEGILAMNKIARRIGHLREQVLLAEYIQITTTPYSLYLYPEEPGNDTGNIFQIFDVGKFPHGIAFDGENVWVANSRDDTVTKLRANDGKTIGTFKVGEGPESIAFDGVYVWVANSRDDTVTKLRANDGKTIGTFKVGAGPVGITFDGVNVWVTNSSDDTVTKLRANDGKTIGTFKVGAGPVGITFDGVYVWVINANAFTVTKLMASDGRTIGTFRVGDYPLGITFDGANVWVTNHYDDSVTKLRANDGKTIGTFEVGQGPRGIVFDGANVWVSNERFHTVSKLNANDGVIYSTFQFGKRPHGIAFDGTNIWVTNAGDNTVTRLSSHSEWDNNEDYDKLAKLEYELMKEKSPELSSELESILALMKAQIQNDFPPK